MRIVVKDTDNAIVDDVERFFYIPEPVEEEQGVGISPELDDIEMYFFTMYEGGSWLEFGPKSAYAASQTENPNATTFVRKPDVVHGSWGLLDLGIIQWTTGYTKSTSLTNVQGFCTRASEINPTLCGGLAKFGSMSNSELCSSSNITALQQEMKSIGERDLEGLLAIEMQVAKEGYWDGVVSKYPWIESRRGAVKGSVMSGNVYTGHIADGLTESMSDEEIINAAKATLTSDRQEKQTAFALDIVSGKVTKEVLEEFLYYGRGGEASWGP